QHATAIEELQSTNEELETTNEELQSTNEELETTNEELQSTNEELETTVEELQVANAELGTLNAQLEARTSELKRLDAYHLGLLNSMEQSVFVTDRALVVTSWNQAAPMGRAGTCGSTGFTRCWSNPASTARRWASASP